MLLGLPAQPGGAFLAGLSQINAAALLHEVHVAVLGQTDPSRLAEFAKTVPGTVHALAIDESRRDLHRLVHRLQPDVVQVEALACAERFGDPRSLGVPTIFRAYDITFEVVDQGIASPVNVSHSAVGKLLEAAGLRRPILRLLNRRFQRHELSILRRFDRVLCFSREDQKAFQRHGVSASAVTLPMAVVDAPSHRSRPEEPFRIAFVASFSYLPNVDALFYLLREIVVELPGSLAWQLDVGGEPAWVRGSSSAGKASALLRLCRESRRFPG